MNTYIKQSLIYSSLHGDIITTRQSGLYPNIRSGILAAQLFRPSTTGTSGNYNPYDYSQSTSSIDMHFDDFVNYGDDEYVYGTQATTYYDIISDSGYVIDKVYIHSMSETGVEILSELVGFPNSNGRIRYSYTTDMFYNYEYQLLNVIFKPILVTSVVLNEELVTSTENSYQLTTIVSPPYAVNKTVEWSSSDEDVATVNQNGLVTRIKIGEVDISATSTDGSDIVDVCKITFTEAPAIILPTSLIFNQPNKVAYVEDVFTIMPTFFPVDTTDKTLTWACSHGLDIYSGQVAATQVINNVTISATTTNGITASYNLNIYNNKIALDKTNVVVSLDDKTTRLNATVVTGTGSQSLNNFWFSSDESIATVEDGFVTLIKEGSVDIVTYCGIYGSYPNTHTCHDLCKMTIVKPIEIPGFELPPDMRAEAILQEMNPDDFKIPTITFVGGIPFLLDLDAILLAFKENIMKILRFTKEQISKMVQKFDGDLHLVFIGIGKTLSAVGKTLISLTAIDLFNLVMSFAKDSMLIAQLKAMVEQAKGYINNIKTHAATIATPITAFPSISAILAALQPLIMILKALGLMALILKPLLPFIKALVAAINAVNAALEPVYAAPVVGALFPKLVVSE